MFIFYGLLLLFPFHAKGRIGQHIVKSVCGKTIVFKGAAIVDGGILSLDQHIRAAYCIGLLVPVLPIHVGLGIAVQLFDIGFSSGEHTSGSASGIEYGLHYVAFGEVCFRTEQQINHQFDHFPGSEMLSGFLIGLLRADANQFFKYQPHLHIVHSLGAQIELVIHKFFDYQIEQIGILQAGDLFGKRKVFYNFLYIGREIIDVGLQIDSDVICVIQQLLHVHLRFVVEGNSCDPD